MIVTGAICARRLRLSIIDKLRRILPPLRVTKATVAAPTAPSCISASARARAGSSSASGVISLGGQNYRQLGVRSPHARNSWPAAPKGRRVFRIPISTYSNEWIRGLEEVLKAMTDWPLVVRTDCMRDVLLSCTDKRTD